MRIVLAAALASVASSASAQQKPPTWPEDLVKAVQGLWLAENNLEAIEVQGKNVVLREHSQFQNLYSKLSQGATVAVLSEEDVGRRSEYHRFIKAQCMDASTNNKPYPCTAVVNMGKPITSGPYKMNLTIRDRYWKQKEIDSFSREHRKRKPGG